MLAGRRRVAEAKLDLTEVPTAGAIVGAFLERALEARRRRREIAGLLLQDAEQVRPQEALRIELLGVQVAGGGGVGQLVGVVELAHVAEGGGLFRGLPPG